MTAVKGHHAEKSPEQEHRTALAPILGTVMRDEPDCTTVCAAVTVTVTVTVTLTVTVTASEWYGYLQSLWL